MIHIYAGLHIQRFSVAVAAMGDIANRQSYVCATHRLNIVHLSNNIRERTLTEKVIIFIPNPICLAGRQGHNGNFFLCVRLSSNAAFG